MRNSLKISIQKNHYQVHWENMQNLRQKYDIMKTSKQLGALRAANEC